MDAAGGRGRGERIGSVQVHGGGGEIGGIRRRKSGGNVYGIAYVLGIHRGIVDQTNDVGFGHVGGRGEVFNTYRIIAGEGGVQFENISVAVGTITHYGKWGRTGCIVGDGTGTDFFLYGCHDQITT